VGGGAGKAGKGSAHERSPINWGAVAARDALLIQVTMWTDIDAVRRDPKAAGILSGVGLCVKNAYRAIDRMQDRVYLGKCLFVDENSETCEAEIWGRPGENQATCPACGITHDVFERRRYMLERAEDLICTVREASQYIGSYGDLPITETTIRNWINRGQLATRPGATDERHILFGDLLTLITDRAKKKRVSAA
jgi:hypothetical protein